MAEQLTEQQSTQTNIGDLLLGIETPVAPAVETPVAPVAETPQAPAEVKSEIIYEDAPAEIKVEAPVFDEAKYLSENFGFDKETVKQKIAEFERSQQELAETKVKLNEPKFKNKASELFDDILSKAGGDLKSNSDFIKRSLDLLTTDEATLQPLDLVKFDIKRQYPAMGDDQLNAYIAKKYSQTEFASDEDKAAGAAELMMDSQKALTNIKEMKAKVLETTTQSNTLQQVQQERVKQEWTPQVKKVVDDFKEIPINLGKINGKNASMKFQVPNDVKQKYTDLVYSAMTAQGQLPTQEALVNAQQTLKAMYLLDNFDHITSHIATQLASQQIKKEVQEYNNPNALGRTSQAIETEKSDSQRIYEALGGK